MVSYCSSTRRIAVGAKSGGVALYELKQAKCHVMAAHNGAVAAVAFSPDGKFLASYSYNDNKLLFWQVNKMYLVYKKHILIVLYVRLIHGCVNPCFTLCMEAHNR